jgi:hypothetical protein
LGRQPHLHARLLLPDWFLCGLNYRSSFVNPSQEIKLRFDRVVSLVVHDVVRPVHRSPGFLFKLVLAFHIREIPQSFMLSVLANKLTRVVRKCPQASAFVSSYRYSVGYSPGLDPSWHPVLSPARRRNGRAAAAVAFLAAAMRFPGAARRVSGDSTVRPAASGNRRHSIRDITGGRRACTPPGRRHRVGAAELGALGGTRTPQPFRSSSLMMSWEQTRTLQHRLRLLPSRTGVYFVLALGMFPGLGYLRVWDKLTAGLGPAAPGPSEKALRDLRRRLGPAPLKALFEVVAGPLDSLFPGGIPMLSG